MRFATISAAALTFAVSALAQTAGFDPITNPLKDEKVAAGSKYTIKWQPGDVKGTVKIGLIGGATQNTQEPISTIQAGVDNQAGSFEWDVPASLGDKAVYGLTITLESEPETFQYSFPFHISAKEGGSKDDSKDGYPVSGKPTVTVSLSAASSSAPATTSSAASSKAAAATTSSAASSAYSTMTAPSNSSSSATKSAGASTTLATVTGGSGSDSTPTGTPVPVPTAGASRVASGSVFALGVVAAFFLM